MTGSGRPSPLWSGPTGRILLVVAFGWFFSIGVRMVFPAILPTIRTDLGIGLAAGGLLITLLYTVYGLGQFPGGVVGDAYGERRVLVLSSILAAVAIAVIVVSRSLWGLSIGLVCFGFATALYAPSRFTILSATFPKRDGTAIGVTLAAGNAGNALLPASAGVLALYLGWRVSLGFAVPFFLATAVLLYWALPVRVERRSSEVVVSRSVFLGLLSALNDRAVIFVAVVLLLWNFTWQAFTGLYPSYLVSEKGFSTGIAATVFGTYFAMGLLIQPMSGAIRDRIGHRSVLTVIFAVAIPSLALLPLANSLWAVLALTILVSSLLGASPVIFPYLIDALPDELRASGLGFVRTGYMMLGASGPLAIGIVGDLGYFDAGFVLLGGLLFVALVLSRRFPS